MPQLVTGVAKFRQLVNLEIDPRLESIFPLDGETGFDRVNYDICFHPYKFSPLSAQS